MNWSWEWDTHCLFNTVNIVEQVQSSSCNSSRIVRLKHRTSTNWAKHTFALLLALAKCHGVSNQAQNRMRYTDSLRARNLYARSCSFFSLDKVYDSESGGSSRHCDGWCREPAPLSHFQAFRMGNMTKTVEFPVLLYRETESTSVGIMA